jgi:hypothetical protein
VVRAPVRRPRAGANIGAPFPSHKEADMSTASARDPLLEADLGAARAVAHEAARLWWLWLVTGAA